ncbi:MAG: restriction endonuclease [Bacteroidia bacterium]|nr:restriction endonuclease [Bacteroidia bacterium]
MEGIQQIIHTYNAVVKVVDKDAKAEKSRAYGGILRSVKGKLQEHITEEIIKLAWKELGGDEKQLEINSKKVKIPIQCDYISKIEDEEIKAYILNNIKNYYYFLSVDKQIFINKKFVIGIECKAYTENAMLKRILVDFKLLKNIYPNLSCYLFQLESQLGGDYSQLNEKTFGSTATHTLMSYFSDIELKIFTFLKGERKVDQPIHKESFFKPLEEKTLINAIQLLSDDLKKHLNF